MPSSSARYRVGEVACTRILWCAVLHFSREGSTSNLAFISSSNLTTPSKFLTSIGASTEERAASPSPASTELGDDKKSSRDSRQGSMDNVPTLELATPRFSASDSTLATPVTVSSSSTPVTPVLPFSGWTSDRPYPNTIPTIVEHLTSNSCVGDDEEEADEEPAVSKPFQSTLKASISSATILSPSDRKSSRAQIASPIQKFHQRQAGGSGKSLTPTSPTKTASAKISARPKFLRLPSFKGFFDRGPIDTPTIINFVSDIEVKSAEKIENSRVDQELQVITSENNSSARTSDMQPPIFSRNAQTVSSTNSSREPSAGVSISVRQKPSRPLLGKRQRSGGISEPISDSDIAEVNQLSAYTVPSQSQSTTITQPSQSTTSTISCFQSKPAINEQVDQSIDSTATLLLTQSSLTSAPSVVSVDSKDLQVSQLSLSSHVGGMYLVSIPNQNGGSTLLMRNKLASSCSQPSFIIPPDGSCFVKADSNETGVVGPTEHSIASSTVLPSTAQIVVSPPLAQVASILASSSVPQLQSQQPVLLLQNPPTVTLAGSVNLPHRASTVLNSSALSSSLPADILRAGTALQQPQHQQQIQHRLLVQSTRKQKLPKELERMNSASLSSSFGSFQFSDPKLKKALEEAREDESRQRNISGGAGLSSTGLSSTGSNNNLNSQPPEDTNGVEREQIHDIDRAVVFENPSDNIASSASLSNLSSETEDSASSQSAGQTIRERKPVSSKQLKQQSQKRRGLSVPDSDDPEERKRKQLEANRAAVGRCRQKHKQKEKAKDDRIMELEQANRALTDALIKKEEVIAELTRGNDLLRRRLGTQSQVLES